MDSPPLPATPAPASQLTILPPPRKLFSGLRSIWHLRGRIKLCPGLRIGKVFSMNPSSSSFHHSSLLNHSVYQKTTPNPPHPDSPKSPASKLQSSSAAAQRINNVVPFGRADDRPKPSRAESGPSSMENNEVTSVSPSNNNPDAPPPYDDGATDIFPLASKYQRLPTTISNKKRRHGLPFGFAFCPLDKGKRVGAPGATSPNKFGRSVRGHKKYTAHKSRQFSMNVITKRMTEGPDKQACTVSPGILPTTVTSPDRTEVRSRHDPDHRAQFSPLVWSKYLNLSLNICDPSSAIASVPASGPSPALLDLLLDAPSPRFDPPDSLHKIASAFGWSQLHKSPNISLSGPESGSPDPRAVAKRYPVAMSTDAVRGAVGLTRGLHVWRVHWPDRHRGTHAVVGLVRGDACRDSSGSSGGGGPYRTDGYRPLVGTQPGSWGWDLATGRLYDGDAPVGNAQVPTCQPPVYPASNPYSKGSTGTTSGCVPTGDSIHVVLDMGAESGTLGFYANGRYLGHAFQSRNLGRRKRNIENCDLPDQDTALYPIVSAVWGHCEIRLEYINGLQDGPVSLKMQSRYIIRKRTPFLQKFDVDCHVDRLNIPKHLLQYLLS